MTIAPLLAVIESAAAFPELGGVALLGVGMAAIVAMRRGFG